jgi:hypothetical protein
VKILLDHCVPRPFGRLLSGHDVQTTFRMGWADVDNGRLLARAASAFDLFVTIDQKIRHEQNLLLLPLPVVALEARNNRVDTLTPLAAPLLEFLRVVPERALFVLGADGVVRRAS